MQNVPLHPMIVHLPLALAALMPLLASAMLLCWWRDWIPGRRAWMLAVVFQVVLVGSGIAALRTGEAEEERVEQVVGGRAVHDHEEAAEAFTTAAGITLALFILPLVLPNPKLRWGSAIVAVVATVVVTVLGVRTGEEGGELVYQHGAASAYHQAGAGAPRAASVANERYDEHDDDEHDDD